MSVEDDFDKALWGRAQEIHEAMKDGVKVIVEDLFRRILRRTPIDTGRLIANWQVGEGKSPTGRVKISKRKLRNFSQEIAIGTAIQSLKSALDALSDPFTEIRLVNNQPYAGHVHLKGGGASLRDLVELSLQEVRHSQYQVGG